MPDRIRIAVIDDHPLFREGVVRVLRNTPDMEVLAEGASAQDAVRIGRTLSPDIILLDIRMPGGGIEAARQIRQSCDSVKTVILTASENADHVRDALQCGVNGYVLKGSSGAELLKVVRAVQNAESYLPTSRAGHEPSHTDSDEGRGSQSDDAPLTYQEERILELLSHGLTNKEIARRLRVTETMTKHYVSNLCQKLSVRSRLEAALAAPRWIN